MPEQPEQPGQPRHPVWVPDEATIQHSRWAEACASLGVARDRLVERADADPSWFWGAIVQWLGLEWQRSPEAVLDQGDDPAATRFFPGGCFNIADQAVDRWVRRGRGDAPALRWQQEDGTGGEWTYAQLADEVERVASGLTDLGVQSGDRVGMQAPLGVEAVVAQLATARIGAILVPVFSGFAAHAVAERLTLAGARWFIVADRFARRGRWVDLSALRVEVAAQVPTLEGIVVIAGGPGGQQPGAPGPDGPTQVSWESLTRGARPAPAAVLPTDHPLAIAYTSGTTGRPKGITLGQAGLAVKVASDAALCFDIHVDDVACWLTDPGWIMSPIIVFGTLLNGATLAVYPGAVDHPDPQRLWRLIDDLGITMLGLSPTLVRSLMAAGCAPREHVGSLRVLASSGEPWTPDAFHWLHEAAGVGTVPIINYSGGTEVSGGILGNRVTEPVVACGFAGSMPAMGADIVDEHGMHVATGIGELALRNPSPGMPLAFWAEPERYRATYWSRWPGMWWHGDVVEVDDERTWFIRGRSDDTVKVAGKRIGPAEVEAVVNAHPDVAESAAIGVPDPVKGEAIVVVVRTVPGITPDRRTVLAAEVASLVVERMGRPLAPHDVVVVDRLPRTRSGKIMRRVVRAVYLGEEPGDLSSLDEPDSVEALRQSTGARTASTSR